MNESESEESLVPSDNSFVDDGSHNYITPVKICK